MKNKGHKPASINTESSVNTPLEKISEKINTKSTEGFAFGKTNYTIMLLGLAVIIVGFLIMSADKTEFGFGFMGLTLGPIVVFVGFMIEFFAILKK
jgi:hypothetical protein